MDTCDRELIPAGKLVRVKVEGGLVSDIDMRVVEDNGLLWITGKNDWVLALGSHDNVLYRCRSLTTGEESLWFHYELEVAPTEEATDEVCREGDLQ